MTRLKTTHHQVMKQVEDNDKIKNNTPSGYEIGRGLNTSIKYKYTQSYTYVFTDKISKEV